VCLFTKTPEVELGHPHEILTMITKVFCLCQLTNMVNGQHRDTDLRHLITVECVMFSINANYEHVFRQLAGDGADLSDIRVIAGFRADRVQPDAVFKIFEISAVLLGEKNLELGKRRGL
jgi:hypothetical protein